MPENERRQIVESEYEFRIAKYDDQHESLERQFAEKRAQTNKELREKFGQSLAAEVAYLEDSDSERQHINAFKNVLGRQGVEIPPVTAVRLRKLMYEERMKSEFKDSTVNDLMRLHNFDDKQVAQLEDHFAKLHARINEHAKPLLEPEAFAVFQDVIRQRNLMSVRVLKNAHDALSRTPSK